MHFANEQSKIGKIIPTVIFLVFIFAMAILFVALPKANYSSSEKRYLQKFPEASVEEISTGEFGKNFENYFADHFPLRNFWVGFNAYYKLYTGNNGADGVYNCANGYLINKPVSEDNKISVNTQAIKKFKSSVNAPMTVMVAPSTGYVCSDVLPKIHDKYNDAKYFNQMNSVFSKSDISFVDLRETFTDEYKNGNQLYYKTDHHWTTNGAYTAYSKLCPYLGITPTDKNKFTVEKYDNFYGTTYSTSGFWFTNPDTIEVWNNHNDTASNIKVSISDGKEPKSYDSMYFYDHTKEDDKYPIFLDGNHAITQIENKNAKGGTILLIKDSFSHSLAPFLADNYSKVILVDMRYYRLPVSKLVESEKVDQIVVLYGLDNLATDTSIVWLR